MDNILGYNEMKIAIYLQTCANNSKKLIADFGKMLEHDDQTVIYKSNTEFVDCDLAIMWSMSTLKPDRQTIWDMYRNKNINLLILEVGVLKRNEYWRVGLNGINRSATFFNEHSPADRWDNIGLKLKPWRTNGKNILICAQSKEDICWPNTSMEDWTLNVIKQIRQHSDRPIIVRQHPRAPLNIKNMQYQNVKIEPPKHLHGTYDNFDMIKSLNDVWAVVNHNSNPAIESIINGIPAFVTSEQSLAWDVSNHNLSDIENPKMPDRVQWANDLAYCEWSTEELLNRTLWNRFNRKEIL